MCKVILVAAENELIGIRLLRYLECERFDVELVHTGSEVISTLACRVIDCCVIDYDLPDDEAKRVLQSLNKSICYTPVIVLISNSKCKNEAALFALTPIYLFVKPFTLCDFGSVVRAAVGQSGVTLSTRSLSESL